MRHCLYHRVGTGRGGGGGAVKAGSPPTTTTATWSEDKNGERKQPSPSMLRIRSNSDKNFSSNASEGVTSQENQSVDSQNFEEVPTRERTGRRGNRDCVCQISIACRNKGKHRTGNAPGRVKWGKVDGRGSPPLPRGL